MNIADVALLVGDEIEIVAHKSHIVGLVSSVGVAGGDLFVRYSMITVDDFPSAGGIATWSKSVGGKLVRINKEAVTYA